MDLLRRHFQKKKNFDQILENFFLRKKTKFNNKVLILNSLLIFSFKL